jgi:putative addiction module component (TIGR02574 family)
MPYNKTELLNLSVEEKIKLAEELWESIDAEQLPVTDDEIAIAKERYQDYLKNPNDNMSWDEFRNRIQAKYGF